ncbi:MAG: hypothetical protein K2Q14_07335 [Gammaproteobacteria bacterium]|nr:hypothetical protein [Gammaproteobacteria bacterium]
MKPYFPLISILSFTLSADSLFNASIIWCVLLAGGRAKDLAFFLCVVTLLTFCVKKMSVRLKKVLENAPQKSFIIIRIIGIILSGLFLPISMYTNALWFLYLIGMVFTMLGFLSQLTSETIIGQIVLDGHLSANKGSRMIQMAQQIAAFIGPTILGVTLSLGGMSAVLFFMMIIYSAGTFIKPVIQNTFLNQPLQNRLNTHKETRKSTLKNKINLWPYFFSLCFLTVQIAAFNFLLPLISQHEKMWTANQFGLIDAMAGVGAFICTLISAESGWKKHLWLITFFIIPLVDFSFYSLDNPYYLSALTIFLGFFLNIYLIKIREIIYKFASSVQDFMDWIGRISVMSVLIRSGAPIVLTSIAIKPSLLFFLVGLVVGICILFITNIQKKPNFIATYLTKE